MFTMTIQVYCAGGIKKKAAMRVALANVRIRISGRFPNRSAKNLVQAIPATMAISPVDMNTAVLSKIRNIAIPSSPT